MVSVAVAIVRDNVLKAAVEVAVVVDDMVEKRCDGKRGTAWRCTATADRKDRCKNMVTAETFFSSGYLYSKCVSVVKKK